MNKQERQKAIEDLARKLVANAEEGLSLWKSHRQRRDSGYGSIDTNMSNDYFKTIKALQLINELKAVLGFLEPEETKLKQIKIEF